MSHFYNSIRLPLIFRYGVMSLCLGALAIWCYTLPLDQEQGYLVFNLIRWTRSLATLYGVIILLSLFKILVILDERYADSYQRLVDYLNKGIHYAKDAFARVLVFTLLITVGLVISLESKESNWSGFFGALLIDFPGLFGLVLLNSHFNKKIITRISNQFNIQGS